MLTRGSGPRRKEKRAAAVAHARSGGRDASNRLKDVRILLDVATRISGTETLEEVLEALVEMTSLAINCDRVTFFIHDQGSGELYSRVAQGVQRREIRLSRMKVFGLAFQTSESLIVADLKSLIRGLTQKPIKRPDISPKQSYACLCVPPKGTSSASAQRETSSTVLSQNVISLARRHCNSVGARLKSSQTVEPMQRARAQELAFLDIVADITSQLDLDQLLQRVMAEATQILGAERSTCFYMTKGPESFSPYRMGAKISEIRFPNHAGIAGAVFTTGKAINIPHAYADLALQPSF